MLGLWKACFAPLDTEPTLHPFLCRDTGKVLLVRKVKHGAGKWGMPGGSQDSKDVDSLATAEREFRSEIGEPPRHEVKGQILVKRCLRPHCKLLMDAVMHDESHQLIGQAEAPCCFASKCTLTRCSLG